MSESIEHSRALLLGSGATGMLPEKLRDRLEQARVIVRVEPTVPGALLAARVLLTTLRRLPGHLVLDRTGLQDDDVKRLVFATSSIDSSRPLHVADGYSEDAAASVHVGLRASAQWIRVVPDGYGAQLVAHEESEMVLGRPGNALGSVFAAALVAAEVFKYTAGVLDQNCTRHRRLTFCPVTLTTKTTLAPELAPELDLDIALIGNGAIGTAEALILAELALGGRVILCDPERFGPENRGTYSVGGEREAALEPLKVNMVGDVLAAAGYEVVRIADKSSELIDRLDQGLLGAPVTVLTALDSVEARRESQSLWSEHIIDAQTGDTAAGLCVAVPDGPCLRCFFPEETVGPSSLSRLADKSGLGVELLAHGEELLGEEALDGLSLEQQERLRPHVGLPICGLANALGLTDANADGYMPSVPFVSQTAACLAVGRLLALKMNAAPDGNWSQFSVLHGPAANAEKRNARPDCFCQTHHLVVEKMRRLRNGS
jgi:hypothetical protein